LLPEHAAGVIIAGSGSQIGWDQSFNLKDALETVNEIRNNGQRLHIHPPFSTGFITLRLTYNYKIFTVMIK